MRAPQLTDSVRIDAGFVAGDEVSSHYDPMIAKLIVQGGSRETAIQKLSAALSTYEIAGPITNIEFLKKICQTSAFQAGEVETGFIRKWQDTLFKKKTVQPEVYAQAALGAFYSNWSDQNGLLFTDKQSGFIAGSQQRSFRFTSDDSDGAKDVAETVVDLTATDAGMFNVCVDETTYNSVVCEWDSADRLLTSYFPHTRIETRYISDEEKITLFHQGQQYRLRYSIPKWVEKALGIKDTAHSVLAPMPCKILKVHVTAGERVKKEQVLVVIESMKMETSIRSPQDGIVSKVVHQQGVSANSTSEGHVLSGIRIYARQERHLLNLKIRHTHKSDRLKTGSSPPMRWLRILSNQKPETWLRIEKLKRWKGCMVRDMVANRNGLPAVDLAVIVKCEDCTSAIHVIALCAR